MIIMFPYTSRRAQESLCKGVDVVINDEVGLQFVTIEDVIHEIGNQNNQYLAKRVCDINTQQLEKQLNAIDKIERVNCVFFNNSRLRIDVLPMIPVARIFDDKKSYYINCEGKKMMANMQYHVDVPIVVGHFDEKFPEVAMLPLIDYIKNDSTWNSLVSNIKVSPKNNDIYIIPIIKGHVINFGDTTLIENKFARLKTIYKEVFPVKGWNYYDTISVKWEGQVVATRSKKKKHDMSYLEIDSIENESIDVDALNAMKARN